MALTANGIGSGLDVNGLVNQLVSLERQKFNPKLVKQADFKERISVYGQIKSNLAALQDVAKKIRDLAGGSQKTSNTSPDVATATLSTGIVGTYNINVTQLASRQALQSGGFGSNGEISGLAGSETLTFDVGAGPTPYTVTVPNAAGPLTLDEVATAINASDSPVKGLVTARVESFAPSVGAPLEKRLVIESARTGADLAFTVTGSGALAALDYPPPAPPGNMSLTQTAADAMVTINSTNYTSRTNEFNGAVSGLNLNALKVGSTTVTGTFGVDNNAVKARVTEFVGAYNKAIANLKANQDKDALLGRESTPGLIESGLRTVIAQGAEVNGNALFLADFGLKIDKTGTMVFDNPSKFDAAVAADPEAAVRFFGSSSPSGTGLLNKLDTYLSGVLNSSGVIAKRSESLNAAVRGIDDDRLRFNQRITKLESRLLKQFSALDASLAGLQSSQNLLQQRLSALQQ